MRNVPRGTSRHHEIGATIASRQLQFTRRQTARLEKLLSAGFSSCAVADVEHLDLSLSLQDTVYNPINMRLTAIEQLSQFAARAHCGAPVRPFIQAENCLLETQVPFQSRRGMPCLDFLIRLGQVALAREVILTRYAMAGFEIIKAEAVP